MTRIASGQLATETRTPCAKQTAVSAYDASRESMAMRGEMPKAQNLAKAVGIASRMVWDGPRTLLNRIV